MKNTLDCLYYIDRYRLRDDCHDYSFTSGISRRTIHVCSSDVIHIRCTLNSEFNVGINMRFKNAYIVYRSVPVNKIDTLLNEKDLQLLLRALEFVAVELRGKQ